MTTLFGVLGLLSAALFQIGFYFPIWLSVLCLISTTLYLLHRYIKKQIGIIILLAWLVYALPFIHIPPYLFFDFCSDPPTLWGLAVNPYMLDRNVVMITAMLGAVGAMGISFGVSLARHRIQKDHGIGADGNRRSFKTMDMPIWLAWVFIGTVFTALSAPKHSIFLAAYTESKSALDGISLDSAWMTSYVILSFAFCDALLERTTTIRYIKMKIILATITLVTVYFQFLRGNRECVPWVFGLVLAYYCWAAEITQRRGLRIRWLLIAGAILSLVLGSMVLGAVRSGLSNTAPTDALLYISELYKTGTIGLSNVLHGTWSAVLLTPLSVAGDYFYGELALKWGQDYFNLLLSIVPGIVADAIGYARPISSTHGPAWEMRYGAGGTHAVVLPFMNFRMVGVFIVSAIWISILISLEKRTLKHLCSRSLSLLIIISMSLPHWLWYGEKNIINALILWLIFGFFYRLSIGYSRRPAMSRLLKNTSSYS